MRWMLRRRFFKRWCWRRLKRHNTMITVERLGCRRQKEENEDVLDEDELPGSLMS